MTPRKGVRDGVGDSGTWNGIGVGGGGWTDLGDGSHEPGDGAQQQRAEVKQ